MNKVQDFVGKEKLTIAEAMHKIAENIYGIFSLVNENNVLSGYLTDGSIRCFILGKDAVNKQPKVVKTIEEARKLY